MAWFKKARKPIVAPAEPSRVPEGLWVKCPDCGQILYTKDLAASLSVCPKCTYHFRLTATDRLRLLLDDGEWVEHDAELVSTDPLNFKDTKPYKTRLADECGVHWTERCRHCRERSHRRTPGGRGGHGVPIHWREYGRRGGREDYAGH